MKMRVTNSDLLFSANDFERHDPLTSCTPAQSRLVAPHLVTHGTTPQPRRRLVADVRLTSAGTSLDLAEEFRSQLPGKRFGLTPSRISCTRPECVEPFKPIDLGTVASGGVWEWFEGAQELAGACLIDGAAATHRAGHRGSSRFGKVVSPDRLGHEVNPISDKPYVAIEARWIPTPPANPVETGKYPADSAPAGDEEEVACALVDDG
jgi:hypothetical protein